jgi:hypothetical protein
LSYWGGDRHDRDPGLDVVTSVVVGEEKRTRIRSFIKFERMYYLRSWSTGGTRKCYFYQDATDFEDRMRAGLATTLKATP